MKSSLLRRIAWAAAAFAALVIWTTLGFLVLMPLENLAPVQGPEQAPEWLVYLGVVFLGFAWPLLFLWLTRRLTDLNQSLTALYLIGAAAFLLGGGVVIFASELDTLQRVLMAILMASAAALHVWSSKRIERRSSGNQGGTHE